jgi:hypothetical protein
MNVAEREQELLGLVREYREGECARLLEAALREGDRLIREAWKEGRRRLHRVVSEERESARSRVRSAEAELSTHRRMHEQRSNLALLNEAWDGVQAELRRQWTDAEGRRHWVEQVLAEAAANLPPGRRTLEYPQGWAETERRAAAEALTLADSTPPEQVENPHLEAGLVVSSGHARLDASLRGLLADRTTVEARLLALLERRPTR